MIGWMKTLEDRLPEVEKDFIQQFSSHTTAWF